MDGTGGGRAPRAAAPGWLPRAEHVWVTSMNVADRHPGLLLAWRRSDRPGPPRWEGWVIFARPGIDARGDGPYVTQLWVEASGIEQRPPP